MDSVSGISTYELLALAWHGIHDEAKCQGTLDARRALYIEGLYEIQRCYNLNEAGEDNLEADDYPSCDGGTFNKIIEKLMGIHANVEINYSPYARAH